MGLTEDQREYLTEHLAETNPDALTCDGHENALIGIAHRFGLEPLACYSIDQILTNLERDGMTREEAQEFFDFNIIGAWVGDGTPIFLWTPEET
jgi:hypothetical protein